VNVVQKVESLGPREDAEVTEIREALEELRLNVSRSKQQCVVGIATLQKAIA
jgi:hypothetical protein